MTALVIIFCASLISVLKFPMKNKKLFNQIRLKATKIDNRESYWAVLESFVKREHLSAARGFLNVSYTVTISFNAHND